MRKLKVIGVLALIIASFAFRHPYHVNVIEVRYNPADSAWQMTVRVFTHEWEGVLPKLETEKINLKNEADSIRNNQLLNAYLQNHLTVKSDSVTLKWAWIGFETKQDETWCYLETTTALNKEIHVITDILYEHGHQQQTIVHLYVNGKRFSRRITAPEKELVLSPD